jgi:hypothetical protein
MISLIVGNWDSLGPGNQRGTGGRTLALTFPYTDSLLPDIPSTSCGGFVLLFASGTVAD